MKINNMSNKTYYLFGSEAIRMYHNGVLPNNNSVELAVFEYNNDVHQPSDLLEAYDGWNGYAIITENEYKLLKDLSVGR